MIVSSAIRVVTISPEEVIGGGNRLTINTLEISA